MVGIGVDIGQYSVKVAEIEITNTGIKLNRYQSHPLSLDPTKDKEIEILDILRSLAQEYDPSYSKFVLGLPQNEVVVRQMIFPFKERHKILKSLPFELEDDIPFSHEDAIFNARVNRYIGSTADISAVACPNTIIEKAIQLSQDCQFSLDILSVNAFGLSNLFVNWQESPPNLPLTESSEIAQPVEIVIDLGHKNTNLLVLKDKQVLEVRGFDWGGLDLAKALANNKSQHLTEAIRDLERHDKLLITNDDATQEQVKDSDLLKLEIDNFAKSLRLTLIELKSLHNINYVKGLLTGGLSQLKNLAPYLTQKLEIPFGKVNILNSLNTSSASLDESAGFTCPTAVGLAIEALKRPKNPPLNMRLGEFKLQSQSFKKFMDKWSHALSVTAAIFVFFVVFGVLRENFALSMMDQAELNLREKASDILGEKASRVNMNMINSHIRRQKNIQKNLKATESLQHINSGVDILNILSQKMPSKKSINMNLFNFSLTNEDLNLEGEVKTPQSLELLNKALKDLAYDNKVIKKPATVKAQPGWTAFAFNLKVKRFEDF